jgi:hypothetical protein
MVVFKKFQDIFSQLKSFNEEPFPKSWETTGKNLNTSKKDYPQSVAVVQSVGTGEEWHFPEKHKIISFYYLYKTIISIRHPCTCN